MAKSNYHQLVEHVPAGEIDPEIGDKLDAIERVAEDAARTSQSMGARVEHSDNEAVSAALEDEG